MKKLILSSVALVAMAGTAIAADLPSIKSAPVVAPAPMWTGFYAGLNAGGTWGAGGSVNYSSIPSYVLPLTLTGMTAGNASYASTAALVHMGSSQNSSGLNFIGGGQVGYNFNFLDRGIFGLETDFQGVAGASSNSPTLYNVMSVPNNNSNAYREAWLNNSSSLNYLGTVRARLGYLVTPSLLIYGTAGFAYGGVTSSSSVFSINHSTYTEIRADQHSAGAAFGGSNTLSNVTVGWTAGAGLEWMLLPSWSIKAEYLYYDIGTVSNNYDNLSRFRYPDGVTPQLLYTVRNYSNTHYNGNIVRAGINYHFNLASTPVVAKY